METHVFAKLLPLLLLGQVGSMILFNWIRKSIYLARKDSKKFICLISAVYINFFFYTYFFTESGFYDSLVCSLVFVPFIIGLIIDFCVVI
jgi:hypothetical protein